MKQAKHLCDLIKRFDPFGMADLTPDDLPDTDDLVSTLVDHYVGGALIPPNDPEFLRLITDIERSLT